MEKVIVPDIYFGPKPDLKLITYDELLKLPVGQKFVLSSKNTKWTSLAIIEYSSYFKYLFHNTNSPRTWRGSPLNNMPWINDYNIYIEKEKTGSTALDKLRNLIEHKNPQDKTPLEAALEPVLILDVTVTGYTIEYKWPDNLDIPDFAEVVSSNYTINRIRWAEAKHKKVGRTEYNIVSWHDRSQKYHRKEIRTIEDNTTKETKSISIKLWSSFKRPWLLKNQDGTFREISLSEIEHTLLEPSISNESLRKLAYNNRPKFPLLSYDSKEGYTIELIIEKTPYLVKRFGDGNVEAMLAINSTTSLVTDDNLNYVVETKGISPVRINQHLVQTLSKDLHKFIALVNQGIIS